MFNLLRLIVLKQKMEVMLSRVDVRHEVIFIKKDVYF